MLEATNDRNNEPQPIDMPSLELFEDPEFVDLPAPELFGDSDDEGDGDVENVESEVDDDEMEFGK
ncbi:hypothetical protein CVT25_013079 [Psilocybe cyanescens]|uniref:Uncharacterized protein n=1 Tax=Psilocybe cyanescens TaxID=93625 RepID=A0A409XWP4_PSICY|nr:hypothetical protein CVT25_013079 [Psilocybe cyanescens]